MPQSGTAGTVYLIVDW